MAVLLMLFKITSASLLLAQLVSAGCDFNVGGPPQCISDCNNVSLVI